MLQILKLNIFSPSPDLISPEYVPIFRGCLEVKFTAHHQYPTIMSLHKHSDSVHSFAHTHKKDCISCHKNLKLPLKHLIVPSIGDLSEIRPFRPATAVYV